MANEGNKKRLAANAAFMKTHTMILLIVNAIYLAYRVGLHFASFSGWHWAGLAFTSFVYLLTYYLLRESAKPRYAPLNDGGALLSGGEDMDAGSRIGTTTKVSGEARLPRAENAERDRAIADPFAIPESASTISGKAGF